MTKAIFCVCCAENRRRKGRRRHPKKAAAVPTHIFVRDQFLPAQCFLSDFFGFFILCRPHLGWNFMHLVFDLRRIDGFLLGLFCCYHKPNIWTNLARKRRRLWDGECYESPSWSHFGFKWKFISSWICFLNHSIDVIVNLSLGRLLSGFGSWQLDEKGEKCTLSTADKSFLCNQNIFSHN